MPLEIRELVIKVNIEKSAFESKEMPERIIRDMKQEIIKECTKAILSKIGNNIER